MHNFIWVSSTMQKFNNIKIQWKLPERQKDRWTDPIYHTLLATARDPKWIFKIAYFWKKLYFKINVFRNGEAMGRGKLKLPSKSSSLLGLKLLLIKFLIKNQHKSGHYISNKTCTSYQNWQHCLNSTINNLLKRFSFQKNDLKEF